MIQKTHNDIKKNKVKNTLNDELMTFSRTISSILAAVGIYVAANSYYKDEHAETKLESPPDNPA